MKKLIVPGGFYDASPSKVTLLSTQVVKRGKKYTCSCGGDHGKVILTFKCKDYRGLHFVGEVFGAGSSRENNVTTYHKEVADFQRDKRGHYIVSVYYIPRFCDDAEYRYDNFKNLLEGKPLVNTSVYWTEVKRK